MKDQFGRTKVVVRQLPPTLSHSDFFSQIVLRFSERYSWSSFRPGKISYRHQRNACAYINFNTAEDVFEFAEFFNGHVFVNEKGAHYKAIVEYAPSQRITRSCSKRDGREGTIYKDPDYLDFLKFIAKPTEHLPSAEIQLERKEAEQAGASKESPIVTPLMEFVRKKRAVGNGLQGKSVAGKFSRRGTAKLNKSGLAPTKRSSEKKEYIMKEIAKESSRKEKSAFIAVARREDLPATSVGKEMREIGNGIPLTIGSGKKKILLLKGKERGTPQASDGVPEKQDATNTAGNSPALTASRQKQRREAGGKLIRNTLLSNDARQSASTGQQRNPNSNVEKGKRPPRSNSRSGLSDRVSSSRPYASGTDGPSKKALEDEFLKRDTRNLGSFSEKAVKRTRNKDRANCGVWAPHRRSDAVHRNEDLSSSMFQSPAEGYNKQYGRRVAGHSIKDDASSNSSDSKSSRRSGVSGPDDNEKQVWVQKPTSGS